ncbi:TonB-dependent receptor [Arenibacter sp. ARW7G5Y1]|uniref:SusC/RagA family TonB-linked outer membrane protein n=1 Tax=Arenibacter sp. ARW7G5Y1 TaxID=2135619 RepID=UPI000D7695EB|nr:TonB-dependent receptor [Arenibacter sp. ARW7G5Y1]PXX21839.1 TonB-linked SusC/RagA family outer membrane protein [Arenibacter sp. ARW7G5Y1]
MKNLCARTEGFCSLLKYDLKMKISTLFIFFVAMFTMQANSYSQRTKITLDLENVTIAQFIDKIESTTEFRFVYITDNVDLERAITLKVKKELISTILERIFRNTETDYAIASSDKLIHLTKRIKPHREDTGTEPEEVRPVLQFQINGTVTDQEGVPLPGASIIEKGTTNGTQTDFDGKFSLKIIDPESIIVVSYLGYKTKEVEIEEQTTLNINLQEDSSSLDEVVVVGYGSQKKVNLTGSVSTISTDELTRVPVASIGQSLAGTLPGIISKQSEGKPGSNPSVSIRGFGNPLIIVDGIEQDNYNNIDPEEIKSFSVLKDAAAAIYGSRAGNGVILITTHRGREGAPSINFNTSYSVQAPTVYPEFVDSWEYAIIQNEVFEFNGSAPITYSDEEIQLFKNGTDPDYPNTKWYDEVIQKWSPMQNHNLNVQGGKDNVKYFLSVGHMQQDGIYKAGGVKFKRYNLRSNVDVNISKDLSVGVDLASRITDNNDVPFSSHDIFQTLGTTTNRFPASYPDPTKTPWVGRSSHQPLIKTNRDLSGYNDSDRKYNTAALTLKYNTPFVEGLSFKVRGNYVGDETYGKKWTKPYSTYNYDRLNDNYTVAATGGIYSLTESNSRSRQLTLQGFLEYENSFLDHNIKGLIVSEVIDNKSNWFTAYKDGFISGGIDQNFAGSSENMSTNGSAGEDSRMSYAGRINYSYKSKYLLESTIRYDASSRFSKDYRWGLFPSLLLGWRISEENFVKDRLSFINNLKVKATFSHTGYDGDDSVGGYQYLSTYSFNSQYAFGNSAIKTIRDNGISNPAITWEDIYTYNAAIEGNFWNGKLGFEFDYFYRLRDGVLGRRTSILPNTFGASLPQENINSLSNRGFELVLNHKNYNNEFKYSISANISRSRAKYEDWTEQEFTDPDEERQQKRTGNWVNRTFGYLTDGLFQTQEEIDNSEIDYDLNNNATLQPGMIKYVDVNGDKKIDWRDQEVIGKGGTPEIMFGINTSFEYKGFDASMLWQGASDFNINFSSNMRVPSLNYVWNSYKFLFNDRWTPDNPNAQFPLSTNTNSYMHGRNSDFWLKKAGYVRLKNFSIGYSLPKEVLDKINLNKLRLSISGYNVLTFDKLGKFNFDPEGIGNSWTYPLYKSYSLGLSISL